MFLSFIPWTDYFGWTWTPILWSLLASVSGRWPVEVTNEYGSRLIWGRKRIWLAACLRSQMNMACGPSEVTTEYVPLQYVSWLVWGYNQICPAAICLMDPMMTPWTLKIHENESRTPYFTPLNHLKLIWKQSARKCFWQFSTNFQPFDPMMTPQTPKIHENESRTSYFTPWTI